MMNNNNTEIVDNLNVIMNRLENIETSIGLLTQKDPVQQIPVNQQIKAPQYDHNYKSKLTSEIISDILVLVNEHFHDSNEIPYCDIRMIIKQMKGLILKIDDISMVFCDSDDFCITSKANRYSLKRMNDENRESMKKRHYKLINKYIKMRNDLWFNKTEELDYYKNGAQTKYVSLYEIINDLPLIVDQQFPDLDEIPYCDIKRITKIIKHRTPTNDDISVAFCRSDDFCITTKGNYYYLKRLNDENRETIKNSNYKLINKYINMRKDLELDYINDYNSDDF